MATHEPTPHERLYHVERQQAQYVFVLATSAEEAEQIADERLVDADWLNESTVSMAARVIESASVAVDQTVWGKGAGRYGELRLSGAQARQRMAAGVAQIAALEGQQGDGDADEEADDGDA